MPDEQDPHIWIVQRIILSKSKSGFTIPMGAFGERNAAVAYHEEMSLEVRGLMDFRLVSPKGDILDTTMRETIAGLGIAQVGHSIDGPIPVRSSGALTDDRPRIILPGQQLPRRA